MDKLTQLAATGKYSPIEFIIAARQVPGYDSEAAEHLENQYFDTKGFPITDEAGIALEKGH